MDKERLRPRFPMHIVGYVLHMTAAAIVFLAEADAGVGRR